MISDEKLLVLQSVLSAWRRGKGETYPTELRDAVPSLLEEVQLWRALGRAMQAEAKAAGLKGLASSEVKQRQKDVMAAREALHRRGHL